MNGSREKPGSYSALAGGAVIVLLMLVCALSAGLAALGWQEATRARALRADLTQRLAQVEAEQAATEAQLRAVQDAVGAMDARLADLEESNPEEQVAALEAALAAANDGQQVQELQASVARLQARLDGLQASLDELGARIEGEPADGSRPARVRLTVPRQRQSHNLSCEAAAAAMVARYHGVDLSEAEVLEALPRNENPYLGFRGNVDGPTGDLEDYGVYAGPIAEVLNQRGLNATTVNHGLEGIKAAIARGNPAIAWVTYNCTQGTPSTVTVGGEPVVLVPNQHAVVVTGYSAEGVWANDPWDGMEDFYPAADFERAIGYFGDMALEVGVP